MGGLSFYCTEGREDVEIRMLMTSYRLTFSNDDKPCPRVVVVLSFDIMEDQLVQNWLRPLTELNALATFVTTHPIRGSSCRPPLQLHPPLFSLYKATQANRLFATILDVDPETGETTRAPSMFFKLSKRERKKLADLNTRCTPGWFERSQQEGGAHARGSTE